MPAEAWSRWPQTCRCSLRNASSRTRSCTNWLAKVRFFLSIWALLCIGKWPLLKAAHVLIPSIDFATAYISWVRFYASYPAKAKAYFHYKALHLGHYAKSFALRDPPSRIGGIGKRNWERSQQEQQDQRGYRYCHCTFLSIFSTCLERRFTEGGYFAAVLVAAIYTILGFQACSFLFYLHKFCERTCVWR
jgi:Domain of unknown function (DUF4217)